MLPSAAIDTCCMETTVDVAPSTVMASPTPLAPKETLTGLAIRTPEAPRKVDSSALDARSAAPCTATPPTEDAQTTSGARMRAWPGVITSKASEEDTAAAPTDPVAAASVCEAAFASPPHAYVASARCDADSSFRFALARLGPILDSMTVMPLVEKSEISDWPTKSTRPLPVRTTWPAADANTSPAADPTRTAPSARSRAAEVDEAAPSSCADCKTAPALDKMRLRVRRVPPTEAAVAVAAELSTTTCDLPLTRARVA